MSTGADNKTMPASAEYREGYDRIFGKDRKVVRGFFIWDDAKQEFVPANEYRTPETQRALDAPIMVDRFYEGTKSPIDGADIGTRQKYREHMKKHDVTHFSDFTNEWAKAEEKRERYRRGEGMKIKGLREAIERKFYEIQKP